MSSNCCGPSHSNGQAEILRDAYGYVLDAFPKLGRAPGAAEIAKDLHLTEEVVISSLRQLEARGSLKLDPESSAILDAYPYSAVPTKHTVRLPDGITLYCMCAIDVFYVPFLIGSNVSIRSRCHYCDAAIAISVVNGALSHVDPHATVVWDSAAAYDCPLTNFFCSAAHLREWHDGVALEPGRQIAPPVALKRGRIAAARIRGELARMQPFCRESVERFSTITCPHCGGKKTEEMPTDACVFFYECTFCGTLLKPLAGDCCVFCSYGSDPCPPIQR